MPDFTVQIPKILRMPGNKTKCAWMRSVSLNVTDIFFYELSCYITPTKTMHVRDIGRLENLVGHNLPTPLFE